MELRPFLKRKRRSFLVSQNTMRRHENPPTILINELLQTPSEFRELWSRSSFLFPFRVANFLPKFFFFFSKKSTPRHATSSASISTEPPPKFHASCGSLAWTRVNTRNFKAAHSRNHADNSAIFPRRLSFTFHRSFYTGKGVSSMRQLSTISIAAINFNPCTVNLYRSSTGSLHNFFIFEISFSNAI